MSKATYTVNGKELSPVVGAPIMAVLLTLAIAFIFVVFALAIAYVGALLALVVAIILAVLPFDLLLRLCGRKGVFLLTRTGVFKDSGSHHEEGEDFSYTTSWVYSESENSTFQFTTRSLREALQRRDP